MNFHRVVAIDFTYLPTVKPIYNIEMLLESVSERIYWVENALFLEQEKSLILM